MDSVSVIPARRKSLASMHALLVPYIPNTKLFIFCLAYHTLFFHATYL